MAASTVEGVLSPIGDTTQQTRDREAREAAAEAEAQRVKNAEAAARLLAEQAAAEAYRIAHTIPTTPSRSDPTFKGVVSTGMSSQMSRWEGRGDPSAEVRRINASNVLEPYKDNINKFIVESKDKGMSQSDIDKVISDAGYDADIVYKNYISNKILDLYAEPEEYDIDKFLRENPDYKNLLSTPTGKGWVPSIVSKTDVKDIVKSGTGLREILEGYKSGKKYNISQFMEDNPEYKEWGEKFFSKVSQTDIKEFIKDIPELKDKLEKYKSGKKYNISKFVEENPKYKDLLSTDKLEKIFKDKDITSVYKKGVGLPSRLSELTPLEIKNLLRENPELKKKLESYKVINDVTKAYDINQFKNDSDLNKAVLEKYKIAEVKGKAPQAIYDVGKFLQDYPSLADQLEQYKIEGETYDGGQLYDTRKFLKDNPDIAYILAPYDTKATTLLGEDTVLSEETYDYKKLLNENKDTLEKYKIERIVDINKVINDMTKSGVSNTVISEVLKGAGYDTQKAFARNKVMNKLEKYKVDGGYDITRYINDSAFANPNRGYVSTVISELKDIGFDIKDPSERYDSLNKLASSITTPKTFQELLLKDPYVLLREDAKERLAVLPESERPTTFISDSRLEELRRQAALVGTPDDVSVGPDLPYTGLEWAGMVTPTTGMFTHPDTVGQWAQAILGVIENNPNMTWVLPNGEQIVAPKAQYVNQSLLDDPDYAYRSSVESLPISMTTVRGMGSALGGSSNPNAGGYFQPLEEGKIDSRIYDAIDKEAYEASLKTMDSYASRWSTVSAGFGMGEGGGGGSGNAGNPVDPVLQNAMKPQMESAARTYQTSAMAESKRLTGVRDTATEVGGWAHIPGETPAIGAMRSVTVESLGKQRPDGTYFDPSTQQVVEIVGKTIDSDGKESTSRVNVVPVATAESLSSLTPTLLAEAQRMVYEEQQRAKAENRVSNADVASVLSAKGYTLAASQIPGAVQDSVTGQWRMKTIADITEAAARFREGVQQQKALNPLTGEWLPLVVKWMEVSPGEWAYVKNFETVQKKAADGTYYNEIVSGENTYITASGEPKVAIKTGDADKSERTILIVDKEWLANKSDKITENWITWEEFVNAVASGRVGRPSVILENQKKSAEDTLKYLQTIDEEIAKGNIEALKLKNAVIAWRNNPYSESNPTGIKPPESVGVDAINKALTIQYFAEYYKKDGGGYDWDKTVKAMNVWGDTGDLGKALGDSPKYIEETKTIQEKISPSGELTGKFTAIQSFTTEQLYSLDKTGVPSTDFKQTKISLGSVDVNGQSVPAIMVAFLNSKGEEIQDSSRTYISGSPSATAILNFANSEIIAGRGQAVSAIPANLPSQIKWEYMTKGKKTEYIDLTKKEPVKNPMAGKPSRFGTKEGLISGMYYSPEEVGLVVTVGSDGTWYKWTNAKGDVNEALYPDGKFSVDKQPTIFKVNGVQVESGVWDKLPQRTDKTDDVAMLYLDKYTIAEVLNNKPFPYMPTLGDIKGGVDNFYYFPKSAIELPLDTRTPEQRDFDLKTKSQTLGKNTTPYFVEKYGNQYFPEGVPVNLKVDPSKEELDKSLRSGRPVITVVSAGDCSACPENIQYLNKVANDAPYADIFVITVPLMGQGTTNPELQPYYDTMEVSAYPSARVWQDGEISRTGSGKVEKGTIQDVIMKAAEFTPPDITPPSIPSQVGAFTTSSSLARAESDRLEYKEQSKSWVGDIRISNVKVIPMTEIGDDGVIKNAIKITYTTDKPSDTMVGICTSMGCTPYSPEMGKLSTEHKVIIEDGSYLRKDENDIGHLSYIQAQPEPMATVGKNPTIGSMYVPDKVISVSVKDYSFEETTQPLFKWATTPLAPFPSTPVGRLGQLPQPILGQPNKIDYVKSMVATSQFVKLFGGDKDWSTKVEEIVGRNTNKDTGVPDYDKAYAELKAEGISYFPKPVSAIVTPKVAVQETQYIPQKLSWQPTEAQIKMRQLMTHVANKENLGQLTEEDKKFQEIVREAATPKYSTTGEINALYVMNRVTKEIGQEYIFGQPKPLPPSLPTIDKFFGTFDWKISARPSVRQLDLHEAAKEIMTADYNLAKRREAFDKALWNSLTPEDKARLEPAVTTTEYDRKLISLWEDPKLYKSSTIDISKGQDPLNYYGLSIRMGKEQVVINKAQQARVMGEAYRKGEAVVMPRTPTPYKFTMGPSVPQKEAVIKPVYLEAKAVYDKWVLDPKNNPEPTELQRYYVNLGQIFHGQDPKKDSPNYNSIYDVAKSEGRLPVVEKTDETSQIGGGQEIPLDQYPRLTPTDTTTISQAPQLPSVTQLIMGRYPTVDKFFGRTEMWARPEVDKRGIARVLKPTRLYGEQKWDILESTGVSRVNPEMWYLGGTAQGPVPPPLPLSGIRQYSSSESNKSLFSKQKEYFESSGGILPQGWIFGGFDNNGRVIPISQDDFNKLSPENKDILLNEGVVGLNNKFELDRVNWDIVSSNLLALYSGDPYEWAYQMREQEKLPWVTLRSLLSIGYSPESVDSIMRGVPKDDELTDAQWLRQVYWPKIAYPQQKYAISEKETPARDIALEYMRTHPNDMRVKYDLSTYRAAIPIESKELPMAWSQKIEKSIPIEVSLGISEGFGKAKQAYTNLDQWKKSINETMKTPEGRTIQAVTFYRDPNTGEVKFWNVGEERDFKVSSDTEWADKALENIMTSWYLPVIGDPTKLEEGLMEKYKGMSPSKPDYAKLTAQKILIDDPMARSAYTLNTTWEFFKALGFGLPITVLKATQQELSGQNWEAAETLAQTTGGMVVFPVTQTGKTAGDLLKGNYNKATGEVGGIVLSFVVNPITVGKGLWKAGEKVVGFPKTMSAYTGSNTVDIPMNPVPSGKGIGQTLLSLQTLMTAMMDSNVPRDAIFYDAKGRLIGRVTPLNRAKVPYQYYVMNRFNEVAEAAKQYTKTGKPIDLAEIGGRDSPWVGSGTYSSPNISIKTAAAIEPSSQIGGGEGVTGVVGKKFTYKQVPEEVQAKYNQLSNLDPKRTPFDVVERILNEAVDKYTELEANGSLDKGTYPVFKAWSAPNVEAMAEYLKGSKELNTAALKNALNGNLLDLNVIWDTYRKIIENAPADKVPELRNKMLDWWLELESYTTKGTKWYPTKATWDTTIKETGKDSAGSYIRASEEIKNDTGRTVYKEGQKVPIIWLSEKPNDLAPSFQQRMLAEWIYEPASVIRRLFSTRPQLELGYGGLSIGDLKSLEFAKRKNVYDYFDKDRRSTLMMKDSSNPERILVGKQYSSEKLVDIVRKEKGFTGTNQEVMDNFSKLPRMEQDIYIGKAVEGHFDTIGGKPHKSGESTMDTVKREATDEAATYAYGGTYVGSVKGRHMGDYTVKREGAKVYKKYAQNERYFDIYDVDYKGSPSPSAEIVELAWYDGKQLYDLAGNPISGRVSDITPRLYKTWKEGLSSGAKFTVSEPPRAISTEKPISYKKEVVGKDSKGKDVVQYTSMVKPEKTYIVLQDELGRLVSDGTPIVVERVNGQTIKQAIELGLNKKGLSPQEYSFVQTWEEFPSGVYSEYIPSTVVDLYAVKLKDTSGLSYINDNNLKSLYGNYADALLNLRDVLSYKEFNPPDLIGKSAYIAVPVPVKSQKAITQIQDKLKTEASKRGWDFIEFPSADKLHITLKYVNNPTARELALLESMANELSLYLKDKPIDITLGEWVTWGKGGLNVKDIDVVSLVFKSIKDMEKFAPLKNKIEALATKAGISPDEVYFDPHVTIAEIKKGTSIDNRMKVGGYIGSNKITSDIPLKIKDIEVRQGKVGTREPLIIEKPETVVGVKRPVIESIKESTREGKLPRRTTIEVGYVPKPEYTLKEEYSLMEEPLLVKYPEYKGYVSKEYVSEIGYPEVAEPYVKPYPEAGYPSEYPPPTYEGEYPPPTYEGEYVPPIYGAGYIPPTTPTYPPVGVPPTPPPIPPPYPPVPPKKIIPPVPPIEKVKRLVKLGDTQGLVAWKQGWVYKVLFPPYGQNDILNSRKPVEGIEYHEGIRSAYDSIVRRGGYIPPIIRRKMGIYSVEISTMKDQRKPELRFRREESKAYKGKKRVAKSPTTRIIRF